ncbi:putative DDE superfamily endonuclease [Monocercomonoides exilis]|uniref:putative DDE superfamily endonuclease n=1 Tax=Monocercomonoides exilis TaxID=2049356 RepID=UPI00355A7528|nr:putative DDE superfamily endonuclease [Monocercomonoides exilis]|eukprot:MONOS_10635.1-p1 / transcript=MONOS_10635.1 / gene=MONOS_10635 / organism=Monocercomonoides_exilis_PA203 / gene_product=DDE superfamily endonuclease / transcript_product=DDE superfamily endonuclease / location=Mono_scaffold00491:28825-29961(+) / protein_length=379 / sequence_SO=supercontig / SO=protein_coding / is_pseudo=false
MATAYQFMKRHPGLKRSSPKNVDVNRLAVSCQSVLQPWYSLLDDLHEKNEYCNELIFNMDKSSLKDPINFKLSVVHPKNENPGFRKEPPKMANSTLVAAVAADGFALPSVILWLSKSLPDEMKLLLSQILDIWPNRSGWMGCNEFKKYALTTLLQGIIDRRKRMLLENSRCLLLIDSHISRADPTIWREFQKENIDVVTFIPHSTHIARPLDRGVFTVLKTELQSKYEPPSSSTSSSKRTALVDVLPQAIHHTPSPAVIKKAFATSGVLHYESGSILMKLPETSDYQSSTHLNRFDFYGKLITDEKLLNDWSEHLGIKEEEKVDDEKNSSEEMKKEEQKDDNELESFVEMKKIKRKFEVKEDDHENEKEEIIVIERKK